MAATLFLQGISSLRSQPSPLTSKDLKHIRHTWNAGDRGGSSSEGSRRGTWGLAHASRTLHTADTGKPNPGSGAILILELNSEPQVLIQIKVQPWNISVVHCMHRPSFDQGYREYMDIYCHLARCPGLRNGFKAETKWIMR